MNTVCRSAVEGDAVNKVFVRVMLEFLGAVRELPTRGFYLEKFSLFECVFGVKCL